MTLNYCLVFLLKCVVVLGVLTDTCTKLDHQRSHLNIYDSLPLGHPGRCLYQLTGSLSGNLYRLEDLPGVGWDNLQNKNMGNVVHHEYRQCKTTSDGKLLIPDGVTVTAIKDSEFQTVAEVFQHWDEYTSTSSSSINAEADIGFDCFGIGGKYSQEYEQTKTEQFSTKSTMTRMQIRLVRYRAQIDTGSRLGHEFRSRLRKIAAHNIQNRTRLATYESQLLVRDFGSHVVNSVILGAALVKTDLMQDDGTYQGTQESKQRMAEVAAHGFFEIFNFGASGQYTTSSSTSDNSGTNFKTLSSRISSIGGKVLRLKNFSAEDWINSVDDNLVVLDRSGEPLHYFVNYNTLRDLPDFIVQKVHTVVKQAVLQYYKQNTYKGCTKFDRPNFSFQANVDDGSCKPLKRKFHFGGVFQECNSQGYANLCLDITVKNPVTGDFSCPANYEKILLNRGSKSRTDAVQQMYQCGHWWHHKQCVKPSTCNRMLTMSLIGVRNETETMMNNLKCYLVDCLRQVCQIS